MKQNKQEIPQKNETVNIIINYISYYSSTINAVDYPIFDFIGSMQNTNYGEIIFLGKWENVFHLFISSYHTLQIMLFFFRDLQYKKISFNSYNCIKNISICPQLSFLILFVFVLFFLFFLCSISFHLLSVILYIV